MPVPTVRVRANRYWFVLYTVMTAAMIPIGIVQGVLWDAPAFWYAGVVVITALVYVQVALAWSGILLPYLRITPYEVVSHPGPPLLFPWLLSTTVRIDPGDRLVATDQHLIIHKYAGPAYRIDVRRGRTYPGDWERMRMWLTAMWPQYAPPTAQR